MAAIAHFSTKGQIVIPLRLRKAFGIAEGTRAVVTPTQDGILIKPFTPRQIKRLRGSLKEYPLLETLKEEKKREREL